MERAGIDTLFTAVETIEDTPFRGSDRAYLLLVYLGCKASSLISLGSRVWRVGEQPRHVPKEDLEIARAAFATAGLVYHEYEPRRHPAVSQPGRPARYVELIDFAVARDADALERLVGAYAAWDEHELGLAFGYPETAVQGYVEGRRKDHEELPITVRLSESYQFLGFRLSQDHWEDELHSVLIWLNAIKMVSPIIYHADCLRYAGVLLELGKEFAELRS